MNITWNKIEKYSEELAEKVKNSNYKCDAIIGIASGGLIPTTLLSKILKIKKVGLFCAKSYCDKKRCTLQIISKPQINLEGENVLLVDDLVDSGVTIEWIKNLLFSEYKVKDVKVAVYFVNKEHCKKYPDFYIKENKGWIVFPWERKENN
ncbi:MAG: phosphoribosyltransferase family protein [Candidatus ainarchaeum sp.]|nr:phosphoribosyltransferase family protein [Candidatus ainarchaeum sp.]